MVGAGGGIVGGARAFTRICVLVVLEVFPPGRPVLVM